MKEKELQKLFEEAFRKGCEWGLKKAATACVDEVLGDAKHLLSYRVTYSVDLGPRYRKQVELIVKCNTVEEATTMVQRLEKLPPGTPMRVAPDSNTLFD